MDTNYKTIDIIKFEEEWNISYEDYLDEEIYCIYEYGY